MQFVKRAIATISVGIAMSMGALRLAAGTTGKRMALPNAKILIHQLCGGFEGQASDIEIQARETIALKRRMEEIVAQHSGQPLAKIAQDDGARLLYDRRGSAGVRPHRQGARAPLRARCTTGRVAVRVETAPPGLVEPAPGLGPSTDRLSPRSWRSAPRLISRFA